MTRALDCEICGETFECAGFIGCWCTEVALTKEKRTELKLNASDCVCPKCLSRDQEK